MTGTQTPRGRGGDWRQPPQAREAYVAGQREAMSHYRPVPQPQYVYVDNPVLARNEKESVTVGKHGVFFEYKTFIAVIVGIAALIIWGSTEFSELRYSRKEDRALIERIPAQVLQTVKEATRPITERLSRLEGEMTMRGISRFTRADHEVWCLNTEKKNAKIGWECGPVDIGSPGSVRGRDLRNIPRVLPNSYKNDWRTRIFGTPSLQKEARL